MRGFLNVLLWGLAFLAFTPYASAQFISGPREADKGELITLKINKLPADVGDMQIRAFRYGEQLPEGLRWNSIRTVHNVPAIQIQTQQAGCYTFVVGANCKGATILMVHVLKIKGDNPPGPNPPPTPNDELAKLVSRLKPTYNVNPNADAKERLRKVYAEMAATTFANYAEACKALDDKVSNALTDNELTQLTDEVANYLTETLGKSGKDFDKVKFAHVFNLLSEALKQL